MKILILSSNLSNEAGGYSDSSFLLREKLDKIKKSKAYLLGFWKSKFYSLNYKLNDRINIFSSGIINKFPFSIEYIKKILNIRPDIIDIQGLWSSTSLFSLLHYLIFKTPYIVTPRGMLEGWALKQSFYKKKIYYFFIEKYHLKFASYLRATSDLEAQTLKNLGYKNIITIPNAIKIPVIRKKNFLLKKKRKRLLFLSRLHPKKGIIELLEAWKCLHEEYLDWELLICGYDENNYKKKIIETIEKYKLKRVKIEKYVTGKDKEKMYRSADLFVLLSHSENFGLVIAEALSFCLPVITTKNTPWKKLSYYKCGWCIDLSIKNAVKTLKSAMKLNFKKKQLMGQRGRNWIVKNFSDQSIGFKMHDVYKGVIKKTLY